MSIGKWLLGGLGFALGGPLGAIIGFIVGSIFGESSHSLPTYDAPQQGPHSRAQRVRTTQGDLRISLLVLISCVMKADKQVLKSEVAHVKPYLIRLYGEEGAKQALHMLKELLVQNIDYAAVAIQICDNVNYSTRLEIIHMLLDIANSDGEIVIGELEMIRRIAANMSISVNDLNSLEALYHKAKDPNWAYAALNITPGATDDEVKKAYRRMAMKYHPDKLTSATEEMKETGAAKFRAVNDAYEHIKTLRGIK